MPQVVPFSPAAGLLEWVEETVPLGRHLIGEDRQSGAHKRYARPGDLSFYDCYTTIDKGQRNGRPRQAFDKVIRNCRALKTGQCVCMMSSGELEHRASSSPKPHAEERSDVLIAPTHFSALEERDIFWSGIKVSPMFPCPGSGLLRTIVLATPQFVRPMHALQDSLFLES